ncbi:MAG: malL [Frankiales bacterium]|nr:malL [Frankiales bacterium]
MSEWWRDAVVYEVYVRSWMDADGDGVGDLDGIRSRLGHLADLGVDAVWTTPFYVSPMADHGYDVADPRDVDPQFGDLAAFDALLAEAHRLGLKVIVDLVPNHSSSAHPWFVEALADPASPMRARYLFRPGRGDGPPNNWTSVFGGPAWSQAPDGAWYLHLFDSAQPDFDWRNPDVHAEWLDVLRFWLDRGVDGFRIDVAHGLYKHPDLPDQPEPEAHEQFAANTEAQAWDQPEVVEVYEAWRRLTDSYDGDRMMVGEVFLLDVDKVARYVSDARLHQAFNFTVFQTPFDAQALRETIEKSLAVLHPATWVLSNHDLTRHVTRYGGGQLGRRRGLAATALLLALPGSPYLYQGEELGLEEAEVPPERRTDPIFLRTHGAEAGRDGCRTPMPWTAEPGHGFTTGDPWLPFGADAAALAVDVQTGDPSSVLETYRRLLARRRALRSTLGDGVEWLPGPPDVLVLRREGGLVCVTSTAAEPVEVRVPATELLESTAAGAELADGVLTLPAATTAWLR